MTLARCHLDVEDGTATVAGPEPSAASVMWATGNLNTDEPLIPVALQAEISNVHNVIQQR
jgi:hypothetical protein